MSRPVWLLDLDGVINAGSRTPPGHATPEYTWRTVEVDPCYSA